MQNSQAYLQLAEMQNNLSFEMCDWLDLQLCIILMGNLYFHLKYFWLFIPEVDKSYLVS